MKKTKILILCLVLIVASMGTVLTVNATNSGRNASDDQREWSISEEAYTFEKKVDLGKEIGENAADESNSTQQPSVEFIEIDETPKALPVGGLQEFATVEQIDEHKEISRDYDSRANTNGATADTTYRHSRSELEKLNTSLSREMLKAYDGFVEGVRNREAKISVAAKLTNEQVLEVIYLFKSDYPEFFWLGNHFSYGGNNSTYASFTPTYYTPAHYGTSTFEEAVAEFEKGIEEFTAGLDGKSEYEKAKIIHDRLISAIAYTLIKSNDIHINQSAYSGIAGTHETVCAGYSKAYQVLLNHEGIAAWYVTGVGGDLSAGSTDNENHAWNAVRIDNKWYLTDVTWDDKYTKDPVTKKEKQNVFDSSYTYFCVNRSFLDKDHKVSDKLNPYMPPCTDSSRTYYAEYKKQSSTLTADALFNAMDDDKRNITIVLTNGHSGYDYNTIYTAAKEAFIRAGVNVTASSKIQIFTYNDGKTLQIVLSNADDKTCEGVITSALTDHTETLVEFYDGNEKVSSYTQYGRSSKYSVKLGTGTYTMKVSKPGHATRKVSVTVSGTTISGGNTSINLLGDLDGNEKIDITDLTAILNHFYGKKTLSDYQFDCMNTNSRDNIIDIVDVTMVSNHYFGKNKMW